MTTPTPEELQREFHAGVTVILQSWSVLRTAVESSWGGGNSAEKADILRHSILQHLPGTWPCPLSLNDTEDALAIYMEEEFSVTLEDDSEKQIAETILQLYKDLFLHKQIGASRQLLATAAQASETMSQYPVQVQSTEHDDEDDDSDMQEEETTQQPVAVQYTGETSLFGGPLTLTANKSAPQGPPARQLGEAVPTTLMEEVDDDGFAAVVTKKKKKSKQTTAM